MKKIILSLVLILFISNFVLAAEPAAPTFTASQDSAYNSVTNTKLTETPNLGGLSDADLSNLMKNKVDDSHYNSFIIRMSEKDFDRALEKDPALIGVTDKNGNNTILNRLEEKIALDPRYINRGGSLAPGVDRRDLKKEWLKQKGFSDEGGGWNTVQVDSFDKDTKILGIKTSSGVTKINTDKVAEICGEMNNESCLTLTDGGSILSPNGVELSNGIIEPSYDKGQMNFKISSNGNDKPIVDLNNLDTKSGQAKITIEAAGTKIINKNTNLGFDSLDSDQLIAEDTTFEVTTLGNGGVSIKPTGASPVNVYANAAGASGTKKLMEITSGSVDVDYRNSICEFSSKSEADVFDSSGEKLFNTEFLEKDVLTTQTIDYVKKYAKNEKAILAVSDISWDNVVSVRDGFLFSTKVYAKPYKNELFPITLDNFANGVDFESDVSGGGKIIQKIAGTDVAIVHQVGKGGSFESGTPSTFRGTSACKYGTDPKQQSKIVFDDGYIFGLGRDTVKVYPVKTAYVNANGKKVYDYSGVQIYDVKKNTETSHTTESNPVVTNTHTYVNSAVTSRTKGLQKRIDDLSSVVNTPAGNQIDFAEIMKSIESMAVFAPLQAKDQCPKSSPKHCSTKVCKTENDKCVAK